MRHDVDNEDIGMNIFILHKVRHDVDNEDVGMNIHTTHGAA